MVCWKQTGKNVQKRRRHEAKYAKIQESAQGSCKQQIYAFNVLGILLSSVP